MFEIRLAGLWALMILGIALAARWGGIGEEAGLLLTVLPALAVVSIVGRSPSQPRKGC